MQLSYQVENARNPIVFYTSIPFEENNGQCFSLFRNGCNGVGWKDRCLDQSIWNVCVAVFHAVIVMIVMWP